MTSLSSVARCLLLAFLVAVACATSDECSAQVARYTPSSPTVSPYLNLTRFNNSALPNYYAFVRPQIRQREFNRQAQAFGREQAQQLVRLQNEVTRGFEPVSRTGTGSWFHAPGNRQSYLNTSRYYPQPAFRGIRR